MYLCDYHTHSAFSFDGADGLADIVQSAIDKGLQNIAFTEHCECNYPDQCSDFEQYYHQYRQTADQFDGRIDIRFGIELGQPLENKHLAAQMLADYPFDFVIGSMHNIPGLMDFYYLDLKSLDMTSLMDSYIESLFVHCAHAHFNVLGHLTYPLRYAKIQGADIDFSPWYPQIFDLFALLAGRDMGIEVNTSCIRKGFDFFMPDLDLIKLYKQAGGSIITVGSDSHNARDIGSDIAGGLELIKQAGFDSVTTFTNQTPEFHKI